HLSRRTNRCVDTMILIADPTIKALDTLKTVLTIAAEIDNPIGRFVLILNRVPVGKEEAVRQAAAARLDLSKFEDVLILPQDDAIFDAELTGQSILHIDGRIPSYQAYRRFIDQLSPPLVK
ncbi:hypothetical protein KKA08_04765, partial [bacterium]|nr:hypothetical protein [bacterium]